jgi:polyisoprenoid-binding protein YceI
VISRSVTAPICRAASDEPVSGARPVEADQGVEVDHAKQLVLGDLACCTVPTSPSRAAGTARVLAKVRGHFDDFEGGAVVDATDLTSSTATLTIQAASIDTGNAQRDEHLRSNDFLAMEEFPQITFVSTGVAQTGATSLELVGDLTIKGVTNSVTIPFEFEGAATDPFGNPRVGFEGSVTVNRKDYGITWNAALETGGVLVSDRIVLEFDVSAIKNG